MSVSPSQYRVRIPNRRPSPGGKPDFGHKYRRRGGSLQRCGLHYLWRKLADGGKRCPYNSGNDRRVCPACARNGTPGTYNGTISIIPAYAGGVVQTVSVILRVSSGGSLTANPNYLSFNYQPGSPFPLPQVVGVVDSSGRSSPFNVTSTTSSGGSWLTYSPSSGTSSSYLSRHRQSVRTATGNLLRYNHGHAGGR